MKGFEVLQRLTPSNRAIVTRSLAPLLCGLGLAGSAAASTTTGQMAVSMTIVGSCALSVANMAFGIYTGALVNGSSTLTVTCTNTTTYQISADNGQNSAFIGVWAKYMLGPSNSKLRYHIYTDAARTVEWNNTPGTHEFSGTGTGAAQPIIFYGAIGLGSYTSVPGNYSDTVTATITF